MDFSKGYYQIPVAPEAKEKLAFSTPLGLMTYLVMPFGFRQRVQQDDQKASFGSERRGKLCR